LQIVAGPLALPVVEERSAAIPLPAQPEKPAGGINKGGVVRDVC